MVLGELADDLEAQGIHGDLFLVGGAAMALAYSTRRATRNLDAVFEPKQAIYDAAGRVGDRHGLPHDWLNEGVKGFLPDPTPMPRSCSTDRGWPSGSLRPGTCSR
jgi:hypothetical protein